MLLVRSGHLASSVDTPAITREESRVLPLHCHGRPLISEQNVEIVRRGWAEWMRGDPYDLGELSFIDPEISSIRTQSSRTMQARAIAATRGCARRGAWRLSPGRTSVANWSGRATPATRSSPGITSRDREKEADWYRRVATSTCGSSGGSKVVRLTA
jgi:hypothetical protein